MLNAMFVALAGAGSDGIGRATACMARQGFIAGPGLAWAGGALHAWAHPSQLGTGNLYLQTAAGAACCVGPIWYRGTFGNVALQRLLDDVNVRDQWDETCLRGNFALLVHTPRRCLLMNDLLGFVRMYVSADRLFYSTSWLAACAYASNVEVDRDAAVEYVLLGAVHSNRTVARGVTTLPLAHGFDLRARLTFGRARPWANNIPDRPTSPAAAATCIAEHLETVFSEVTTAFSGRMRMALSGGFDSRLILAGLLAAGTRPELFVYGNALSPDVRIARAVAASVGTPIDVIDKRALNQGHPLPDVETLVASALFFDGLPNDGIYDLGADQTTRLAQTFDGRLVLNGGGGEIFRNYFHLPNRMFSAMDLVRTFYRGFDSKVFRRRTDLDSYESRIASSIRAVVGAADCADKHPLGRTSVELAYPLFRCHYWMAVNNSVGVRHGYYTTPLVDPTCVQLAWRLPLAWKNAGALESALIAKLHSDVARQPSTHGFCLADGPSITARFRAATNRARPVWARPVINAIGRRARKRRAPPALVAHGRACFPGEWCVNELLDLKLLPDEQAFSRALAIEVCFRESL